MEWHWHFECHCLHESCTYNTTARHAEVSRVLAYCVFIAHNAAMAQTPELIGSPEACRILQIDRSTLSRWVQLNKLQPAFRLGDSRNSQMVFNRDDIEAFKLQMAS